MALPTQAAGWEKVHIFISSTFNDMHAERDYLVKNVFPELSEWCEKRKLRLVDIDLRWGVTEADATHNRNVVNVCLTRIDECRPFFVCFLGQRYGWVPERKDVSGETFERFPGLEETVSRAASVTELEILHALVSPFHSQETIENMGYHPSKHAFFYFRDESYLQQLPPEHRYARRIYTDAEEEDAQKRDQLKSKREQLLRKIADTRRPRHVYSARWAGDLRTPEIALAPQCPAALEENRKRWREDWFRFAGVHVPRLDVEEEPVEASKAKAFNELVTRGRLTGFACEGRELRGTILEELKTAIACRFPGHWERKDQTELQREIDQQEQFVFVNSEGFIRRRGDFDKLDEYVGDNSDSLFVLTGEAGMGKTTLLANWVDRLKTMIRNKAGHSMHFRFIGASDGSTTVSSLLRLLLKEIKEISGKLADEIPDDPQKLRALLPDLLAAIGRKGKTVIVIDALNQLETGFSDLDWLPRRLPEGVKLVVSFKRGEEDGEALYRRFNRDDRVRLAGVRPFDRLEDRQQLIQAYLSQFLKELDERHLVSLVETDGARNPLYLKVVLSELRVFGAFADLAAKIRSDFGDTPLSAFDAVLRRLERDPAYCPFNPQEAVPLLFGLMAHARQGLSVNELTGLFLQALNLEDDQENTRQASDTIHLFLRQVRPFLARRDGRYDFFFESFKHAAIARYVSEEDRPPQRTSCGWHKMLADYFYGLPLWEEREAGRDEPQRFSKNPHRRKSAEMCFHLTRANDWERLELTLCDPRFIEAKCAAGMTYDLISDYGRAVAGLPEARPEKNRKQEQDDRVKEYAAHLVSCAKGKIRKLNILPAAAPWDVGKIEREESRITENPDRFDRIRSYFQFVNSEGPLLARFGGWPGFCLQQACNFAEGSPVSRAAESIVKTEKQTILILRHPSRRPILNFHPALLKTMGGHTSSISAVGLTADGKKAVSGSWDSSLRLWDLESGLCLKIFEGHRGNVESVAVTPEGSRAVSRGGFGDWSLRLWDLENGGCLRVIKDESECLSISADGKLAFSGNKNGTILIWNLATGQCLGTLAGHKRDVLCVKNTPNGKRLFSGGADGTLRIWDVPRQECLSIIEDKNGVVARLDVTPDGKKAATSVATAVLKVWDVESGQCLRVISGQEDWFRNICMTDDGRYAVTAGDFKDQSLRVWDLKTGSCLKTFRGEKDWFRSLGMTPDARIAVTGSGGLKTADCRMWDIERGRHLPLSSDHTDKVSSVSVSPDGRTAISAGTFEDQTVRVWNLRTGEHLRDLRGHSSWAWCTGISPDGVLAVTGSEDQTLRVWDIDEGEGNFRFDGHSERVNCLRITPDGAQAVSGGRDGILMRWDLRKGRCLGMLSGHEASVGCVDLSPDGKLVVSGSSAPEQTVLLQEWGTGRCLKSLQGHAAAVSSVTFTPDGRWIVSSSEDRTIRIWNPRSGACIRSLDKHMVWVESVKATPCGRRILSGSGDQCLFVWDIESGECLAVYHSEAGISSMSDIAAGGCLAVGTYSGQVVIVEARRLSPHPPCATAVRLWRHGTRGSKGRWEEEIGVTCLLCGRRFPVPADLLAAIQGIHKAARLSGGHSPCLELPPEAWHEPRLRFECQACHQTLRLNPFIVDNKPGGFLGRFF